MFCKLPITLLSVALPILGATSALAGSPSPRCAVPALQPARAGSGVIYKVVQPTPLYDVSRPEVVSGARVTLFANFLRQEPGCVTFNLNGTSTECCLVEWKPNSVTVELPRLGLLEPKNATILIILPDGRVAKTFPVVYVSQPDIVIHSETVPQPMPPAPATRGATYVEPVHGGFVLQAGAE